MGNPAPTEKPPEDVPLPGKGPTANWDPNRGHHVTLPKTGENVYVPPAGVDPDFDKLLHAGLSAIVLVVVVLLITSPLWLRRTSRAVA